MYSKFDLTKEGRESTYSSPKSDFAVKNISGNKTFAYQELKKIRFSLVVEQHAEKIRYDHVTANWTHNHLKKASLSKLIHVGQDYLLQQWTMIHFEQRLDSYWKHLRTEFNELYKQLIQSN